jgi:hypothetical protein
MWLFKSFYRTFFGALMAQDTLGCVFALAGIVVHFYLHGTDFQAFATLDAFTLVAMDAK